MKHKDGIECYLKPAGEEHAEHKFREIPQDTDSDDNLLVHSAVLKTYSTFNVEMRFSDTFDMSSASALQVVVGRKTSDGERLLDTSLASVSQVRSGVFLVDRRMTFGYPGSKVRIGDSVHAAIYMHYDRGSSAGDVVVSVTRGHPTWTDGNYKDYAFGPQRQCSNGYFRQLPGYTGIAYIFRFTPQSTEMYRETSKRCHMPLPVPSRVTNDAYVEDADFGAKYSNAQSFNQDIRTKGWERDREEREGARHRGKSLAASEAILASNKDAQLDKGAQEAPASKQARPLTSAEPQSTNELRVVPICSCPGKHPPNAGKSATLKTATPAERMGSASKHKTQQGLADGPRSPTPDDNTTADATVKAHDGAQETLAKQCTSCKKFKAPPSGKKITYRRARGRYMCVPRNAPNEVGPADTVLRRTVSETDSPARPTSEPDVQLADGTDEDSASFATTSDSSSEQEISQSEITQVVSEEPAAQPPKSSTPVTSKTPDSQADETSLDGPSITSTNPITVVGTEATKQPASNKRPAEPSKEQPPAKQSRIEESTIPHNENQSVSIKTEPEADTDIQFATTQDASKTRREKCLEEEIARTQRELRQIELEKKMEELQRQLAAEQRRKQNATPLINVKQEIIELD